MSNTDVQNANYEELSGPVGLRKISQMIKGIRIAMMTTSAKDGTISSRPMAVQNTEFDGTFWFLTRLHSEKVDEADENNNVTLTFVEPKDSKYLSLKGRVAVSRDKLKIQELWSPMCRAWFPDGESDPEIAVLRVDVTAADYWEASESKLIMLARYAAASLTKGKVPLGHSGHIAV